MSVNQQTAMIVWVVFCVSQLIIGGVGVFTWSGEQPENATIWWVLAAMTAPMTLMSVFGANLIIGEKGPAQTRYILRWAFAETIAVFGVTVAALGAPIWLGPAMAGWGFLLVLIAFPRFEA